MKLLGSLPQILAFLSLFPRPLSVVEVAWLQFSLFPLSGADGDTSA